MRLYYFTGEQFGLEAIRDNRLKIARVDELNDPFEFTAYVFPNKSERRIWTEIRADFSKTWGLICMAETWREPLLWGHYADKHRGLCLGFDVDPQKWTLVDYVKQRPALLFGWALSVEQRAEVVKRMIRIKFDAWSYERERRRFYNLNLLPPDPVSGHYFAPLLNDMTLAEVIVGHRSSVTRERLKRILGDRAETVRQIKARPAFQSFEVVEQGNKRFWK
ncbi:DUF2971 domain-containing protein [Sinorhizobium meliloti]|uniref:DUF2971 domain-containing protein n=1 Tax=Rhizobium meliloti TaxID=382 RepID=UPI0001E4DD89|nr:DUF2971 domain-containing protein [Sinorhizobium meliloti]AEG04214.1 Protein of unknown function DUF2971 [Sinorhizobium meliloti BL225C]MDE4545156.1 DUF2971 domain-containing protein [Sinorhizobium meliloti]MDE4573822.1 DUF2971 domain-containing protein [Sinorhizobium meliloti]SDZ36122.1 Protein of unknown function [Sinorhizobium meliloti]